MDTTNTASRKHLDASQVQGSDSPGHGGSPIEFSGRSPGKIPPADFDHIPVLSQELDIFPVHANLGFAPQHTHRCRDSPFLADDVFHCLGQVHIGRIRQPMGDHSRFQTDQRFLLLQGLKYLF